MSSLYLRGISVRVVSALFAVMVMLVSVQSAPVTTKVRQKMKFSYDWRFFKGSAAGTPYQKTYNDGSWEKVNLPHSASYDKPQEEPTFSGPDETQHYKGIVWYRRSFPALKSSGKTFLEFEGAMQTAEVWINETKAGVHDNSGYTGFCFDITKNLVSSGSNVVAVKLDNVATDDIPPGTYLDYVLFSGIYRDVWLTTTGDVHIPYCGQLIDPIDVSTTGGKFRVRTKVTNSRAQAVNCLLTVTVKDANGADIVSMQKTQSIGAGATFQFDDTSPLISNPKLWSPETPNLYYLYTTVSVDNQLTDDYVRTRGLLWTSWSKDTGFSLNGKRYQIIGTNYHQCMAWVEYALPESRYRRDIEMIKDAGFNAIRTSHYPRHAYFYEMCDKMGILLFVEIPTWQKAEKPAPFWNRLANAPREMVEQAYNTTGIITWGMFNEPNLDISQHIKAMHDSVRIIDPYRPTYIGKQRTMTPVADCNVVDVVGLQYDLNRSDPNWKVVQTEYSLATLRRGEATEMQFAQNRWTDWTKVVSIGQHMAGGLIWVFQDYYGKAVNRPFGLVDMTRIPKEVYYYFREKLTGKAPDYWFTGTPTKLEFTADVTDLDADGVDISVLTVALRNSAGQCINTAKPVAFTISGPATIFGATTKTTVAGKIAAIIKTTQTPGTVMVTATCENLPPVTVTLNSKAITDPILNPTDITIAPKSAQKNTTPLFSMIKQMRSGILIDYTGTIPAKVFITNCMGRVIETREIVGSTLFSIDRTQIANGIFYVTVQTGALQSTTRMGLVK
jgi:hypothetical protein